MHRRIRLSISLLLSAFWFGLALSPSLHAQQTLGGITGTVTDPSGAVVANATITMTNAATGEVAQGKTNSDGA